MLGVNERDVEFNELAKEFFKRDSEKASWEQVRVLLWGALNLLLEKELISKEELDKSVQDATMFYNLLHRRYKILEENGQLDENSDPQSVS